MSLPTGTLTFLFTDIEGSTQLLHSLGDRYAEVLADHRDILRNSFNKWSGSEVDTQGDSFFVAFSRASDATAAAVESQRALVAHPWPEEAQIRVRMGLHTGEPELGPTGYVGMDVHRAARISNAAHGGQILLSAATYELLRDEALEGAALRDLGEHRLKDLLRSERLYQLTADGLPSDFPPLRTLNNQRTNLPTQLTSFVGREEELLEIDTLIDEPDCRLLTLVGPGGVGKTRLALQTAAHHALEYPDGTYFVPLAPLTSPDFIVPTVAEALQFDFDAYGSDLDPKSQLLDYLGGQSAFLVMDNFEHVLEGVNLIPEILDHSPNVRILATSRERLNLQGEWTYDVDGMKYPINGGTNGSNGHSAITLFYERARQVDPNFNLSPEVHSSVTRVCQLVDGMPLGIELAAAWVSMLAPDEIAEEIGKNLDFLASSRRDMPEKHRSMHAVFDYSWDLLTEDEKSAFRSLSVFRGGFQRDAARQVAGVELQIVQDLANKSLLKRTERGRYEIHELLRQYAAEKLKIDPVENEAIVQAHSSFYIKFLEARVDDLMGERMLEAREQIRAEMENLRCAVKWAIVHGDTDHAREVLKTYFIFMTVHSWHEARDTFVHLAELIKSEREDEKYPEVTKDPVYLSAKAFESRLHISLSSLDEAEQVVHECLGPIRELGPSLDLASILFSYAYVLTLKGNFEKAIPMYDEALSLARKFDTEMLLGTCLLYSGWNYNEMGDLDHARRDFDESTRLFKSRGNLWGLAYALSKLGLVADSSRDYALSLKHHSESRDFFRNIGDKAGVAYTTSRMSVGAYGLGQYEEAKRLGLEGFESFKEMGHRWGMAVSLCRMGFAELQLSELGAARKKFYDALEGALEIDYVPLALYAIGGIASVMVEEGNFLRATEFFAYFNSNPKTPALYKDIVEPWCNALEGKLSDEELERARVRGREFEFEVLVKELLLEGKEAAIE